MTGSNRPSTWSSSLSMANFLSSTAVQLIVNTFFSHSDPARTSDWDLENNCEQTVTHETGGQGTAAPQFCALPPNIQQTRFHQLSMSMSMPMSKTCRPAWAPIGGAVCQRVWIRGAGIPFYDMHSNVNSCPKICSLLSKMSLHSKNVAGCLPDWASVVR